MSYLLKLYETYEHCESEVGLVKWVDDKRGGLPLLPVSHTTNNAHIEITVSISGDFLRALVIPKEDAVTMIPCTEESGSRAGILPTPHPLFDKLQYVAGDFQLYADESKAWAYAQYMEGLSQWVSSEHTSPRIKAVYDYLTKACLIRDLINEGVLLTGSDGKLLKKWDSTGGGKPAIFGVVSSQQSDAFVRFAVDIPGGKLCRLWEDRETQGLFQRYFASRQEQFDICMVTGEKKAYARFHSKKIRHSADNAKIISGNDSINFTYRGRFSEPWQAVSVSYEVSQKAHNALRWLIDKQGFKFGDGPKTILAWSTKNKKLPIPTDDAFDLICNAIGVSNDSKEEDFADTAEGFARRFNIAMAGYQKDLRFTDEIVVLGLDSATTGRMSVIYYKLLDGSDYLQRIKAWHQTCCWIHDYRFRKVDKKIKHVRFIGAPAPVDIAFAALGNASDKAKASFIERILHCIIDGMPLPYDIVAQSVNRASNPLGKELWEWHKTLSIACALYRKYNWQDNDVERKRRNYTMALEKDRRSRDYLYGRLLAVADRMEARALYEMNKDKTERETNAMRYMSAFAAQPFKVWNIIANAIAPYRSRLGPDKAFPYENLFSEIKSLFVTEEYLSNKPLTGEYLLGFYCQREVLVRKKEAGHGDVTSNDNTTKDGGSENAGQKD